MSSMANGSVSSHSERPERSRNAKAQARHRAKRKAYIEQLEQTVTKLQTALGFSPEQVAALPPPLMKIRELEQENARLHRENEEIRRLLNDSSGRPHHSVDNIRQSSLTSIQDARACDRDYKRRRMPGEDIYMNPGDTPPPHGNDARLPPLNIPQPQQHYPSLSSQQEQQHSNHSAPAPSSVFSLHAPAFQMPNTPSGSSSASSPPFSQPAQIPISIAPNMHHRTNALTNHHHLSNYSHSAHYGSVKVEDEHYNSASHHTSHHSHYSLPSFAHTAPDHQMESWHSYPSERGHLHR